MARRSRRRQARRARAERARPAGALRLVSHALEKTLRSWSEVRRIMVREVVPVWRHRRVVDLHRRGIRELVERKARTAPIQANRALQRISPCSLFCGGPGLDRVPRGGRRSRHANAAERIASSKKAGAVLCNGGVSSTSARTICVRRRPHTWVRWAPTASTSRKCSAIGSVDAQHDHRPLATATHRGNIAATPTRWSNPTT
jgi:hypothetical protein